MEQVKTNELFLAYLRASRFGLYFEELPGLALTSWRIVAICRFTGFWLKNWDETLVAIQFLFSAIMLGFQLCNVRDYIRMAGEQNAQQRNVKRAVHGVSTDLDTFAGVTPDEIMLVLRLRDKLGDALRGLAREITGDVMLLRFVRSIIVGGGRENGAGGTDALALMSMGATITKALAIRKKSGADVIWERILRDDMVSAVLCGCGS